ncbi:MAG: M48 family metallopeptidase [Gammaproteobacteria bacterium]
MSPRARYLRLRIKPVTGLEVVLPKGVPEREAHRAVEQRRAWIEKHLPRILERAPAGEPEVPDRVELAAVGERYRVISNEGAADRTRLLARGDCLHLHGGSDESRRAVLRDWLKRRARIHLADVLAATAEETALTYRRLSVRLQKTRWGSCSTTGTISLNAKLMFLPPHLVRHVLVHELCHTVHMNHSADFWALVSRHDPDWKLSRRKTRQLWHEVPAWTA